MQGVILFLRPPGCSSVLNPFSYCSSQQLCNTTGACSLGQHWCHLTESCLYTTNPCSPYNSVNGAHYALPPRYPAIPPFYHLAVDMPIRMNPSSELQTLKVSPSLIIFLYLFSFLVISGFQGFFSYSSFFQINQ